MEAALLGTISYRQVYSARKRTTVFIDQGEGLLLRTIVIQSVASRQRIVKVSYHGTYRQRWRRYCDYVWERATSTKIPPGFAVYHRDGDSANDAIENLVLSRRQPFHLMLSLRSDIADKRRKNQRKAVRRANKIRHREMNAARDALLQPDAFYLICHGPELIVMKPCKSDSAARNPEFVRRVENWLVLDGIAPDGKVSVLQGAEYSKLARPDGPLEKYSRFIPLETNGAKKGQEPRSLVDLLAAR